MSAIHESLTRMASSIVPLAGGWTCEYGPDETFIGFQGHFQNHPVLPAVVQILMARLLLEAGLQRTVALAEVVQAKFALPVPPGVPVRVIVAPAGKEGAWECTLTVPGGVAARFRLQEGTYETQA